MDDVIGHVVKIQIQIDAKTGIPAGSNNVFPAGSKNQIRSCIQRLRTVGGKGLLQIA